MPPTRRHIPLRIMFMCESAGVFVDISNTVKNQLVVVAPGEITTPEMSNLAFSIDKTISLNSVGLFEP